MTRTFYLAGTASSPQAVSTQFKDLVTSLSQRGLTLVETFPADFYISVNHNPKMYRKFRNSGGLAKNAALIMLEPPAVYPSQYLARVSRRYSIILAPGNFSSNKPLEHFIPWPYECIPNPSSPTDPDFELNERVQENIDSLLFDYEEWSKRTYFLTMVNANKVSAVKDENYSLRRIYAKQIDKKFLTVFGDLWGSSFLSKLLHRLSVLAFSIRNIFPPNLIHIYGNLHWKYLTSGGTVVDKQKIIQASKFSLIIENNESYVSEKLIDALINGSIPVYFGPELPISIIPNGILISLPSNPNELIPRLLKLDESEIQNYLVNICSYVSSQNFIARWDKRIVFRQIATELAARFGGASE